MHTTSIRDFKKEKVLGKGSFGSVYLVRRKQDNKIYALKTVIMEKLNKREQENSVNEVRILASINHPNVIGYKEAFWDDDGSSLNIVMEYADDGDLHSKIKKMKKAGGFFNEPIVWSYSIQMIEGLKALHDKKIMHRDLKSANILLVKDKHQCKLGDMNVSKVIKEKVLRTQTGTPYYASPEVWNDNPYSYKSDLWSIGCVIYELCALRPPFQGKDLDELYENVCRGEPERINKIYSDDLWKMILMLLKVDVNQRVDCSQFLNSDLIKKKIEEMKNNPSTYLEGLTLDKNKGIHDEFLLKTIKFNDISEIKAQLPTKKNYNSNLLCGHNLKYIKNNNRIMNNNNSKGGLIKKNKNKISGKAQNENSYPIVNTTGNNNSNDINTNTNTTTKTNNVNDDYLNKLKDIMKEKELVKKELAKQIEYEKIRDYINKNNEKMKEKNKEREKEKEKEKMQNKEILKDNYKKQQRISNIVKEKYEKVLKHHKTVIYKKSNYNKNKNRFQTSSNKDSFTKNSHPEIEISDMNISKRTKGINSERRKKTDLSELYLKKFAYKFKKESNNKNNNNINNQERLDTPLENYNKLSNNKLSLSPLSRKTDINSNNTIKEIKENNRIFSDCFNENDKEELNNNNKEVCNTIEPKYVYNKKNIVILKKTKISNNPQERPLSATPVYKKAPSLNPSLYQSSLKQSTSFYQNKKNCSKKLIRIITPNPTQAHINYKSNNEIKKIIKKDNEHELNNRKLNRYYSYGISITMPSNNSNTNMNNSNSNNNYENIIKISNNNSNQEKDKDKNKDKDKKYIKKINVKSYKINNTNNKNGKCSDNKDRIKEKKITKKKLNIYSNNNSSSTSGIMINNSNTFLNHIKNINTPHNTSNALLNYYLSPKYNNSQVFNNFYSICGGMVNAPVKVINVYKK